MSHWWKSEHTSLYGMGSNNIDSDFKNERECRRKSKVVKQPQTKFPKMHYHTLKTTKLNSRFYNRISFKNPFKKFNLFSPCWISFWQSGTYFWNPDTKDRKLKSDNHFDKIFWRLLQLYIVGSCALLEKQVLCNSLFSKHQLAQYIVYRHILYKMIYVGLSVLSLLITIVATWSGSLTNHASRWQCSPMQEQGQNNRGMKF